MGLAKYGIVLLLVVVVAIASLGSVQKPTEEQEATNLRGRQRAAYLKGGLHAAARIGGSYTDRIEDRYIAGPVSLEELVALSHEVVVGSIGENVCRPTADGRSIVTLHFVTVETPIAGGIKRSDTLTLAVPGGRVMFEDGTWAQLNNPGFRVPTTNQRVMLFARRADPNVTRGNETFARGSIFSPTSGPLGFYPLSMTNKRYVQAAGYVGSDLAKWVFKQKFTPDMFVDAVKTAASAVRANR